MNRFFKSFTFKIWLPFTVALIFIISISAWYYPRKQEQFLLDNKNGQVQELAKTVAKSYELAFTDSDESEVFRRVKETIDFAKNDHDIDYIQVYENGKLEHKYSKEGAEDDKPISNASHIFEDWKFSYINSEGNSVNGFVRIAILKAGIEDEIFQMNFPIYMILFGAALFFSVTFYLLAGWLSRPILKLTQSALALSNQDFSTKLPEYRSNDEIGLLIKSINELKNNLMEQKSKNDKFVFGLEELVDKRARDLKETQDQMALSQKNADFGTFKYDYVNDVWTSSDVFDRIMGVSKNKKRNYKGFVNLFFYEKNNNLDRILKELIASEKKYFSGDIKIKRITDGRILSLNHVFELQYENSKVVSVIGSVQDITERVHIREELQSTKEALSDINKSLEKKVIENTKKNIDLSRSILEQEKLVTIGEISAGIAHDLNTPLGTIRVGSDNVSYIIDKLFRDDLNHFSKDELIEIIDYVKKNKIEIYVGGLLMRKEKEQMKKFLFAKYPDKNEDYTLKYVDLFVKCRISESQYELIDKIIVKENGIEYLEVLNQAQMAMAQLDTIKTSSDKAVRVVQDMRAFIKGETTVERKMINLRENISTVLGVFNYEINLNVDLKFEVDESIEFMGYDIKLFQLWSNIVKNSLEAMSDQEDKYFGIIGVQEEGQIKVTFENNGPEIPKEIISSIFNKFYTTKSKKSGSGLGLSIVKNVLRDHKAKIKTESTENMTKFIITFEI